MIDIYGCHFEYGDFISREYGLMIASLETSRFVRAAGDIDGVTIFNKKTQQRYLIGDDYSGSPLSIEIEILSDSADCLSADVIRAMEKKLFNRGRYSRLYIDQYDDIDGMTSEMIDGEQKRLYFNCRFINPEKIEYSGGVVGYRVTMETDSHLLWQDSIVNTFITPSPFPALSKDVAVRVDTDIDEYTYPIIRITTGSYGGTVKITNNTDDATRTLTLNNLLVNTTVEINCGMNHISGTSYANLSTRNFVRLLDGDNTINILGDVGTFEVEFVNRRML